MATDATPPRSLTTADAPPDFESILGAYPVRLQQFEGQPKRRWVKTTDSNHSCTIYPNLLPYQPVSALNQVWVADITYISIISAFVYLAVILDLFSRKAIGYGIAKTLETSLCRSALTMAIATRRPPRNVTITQTGVSNMLLMSM